MERQKEEQRQKYPGIPMDLMGYLALEKASRTIRYEYVDGYAYAMAGGTKAHDQISANAYASLSHLLPDGPCQPHSSDIRLKVNETKYFYPDAYVTCEDVEDEQTALHNPSLIMEVRSPGTESFDSEEKWLFYQTLSSLHTYILVSTERQQAEVFQRSLGSDVWTYKVYPAGEEIPIPALGIALPVANLYRYTKVPRALHP